MRGGGGWFKQRSWECLWVVPAWGSCFTAQAERELATGLRVP